MVAFTQENTKTRMVKFYTYYEKHILPILEEYEYGRIKEIVKVLKYCLIALPISIIAVWVLCCYSGTNILISLEEARANIPLLLGGWGLAILAVFLDQNYKYRKEIKKKLMQKVISSLGDIVWYSGKSIISDDEIRKSRLFSIFNGRENDDSFQGTYENVSFRISETDLGDDISSSKFYAAWKTFKGIIISIKSNKKIKAHTIIATKGDINVRNFRFVYFAVAFVLVIPILIYGWDYFTISATISGVIFLVAIIFCIIDTIKYSDKKDKNFKPVYLEDPVFNNKYKTYSEDQVEGRYLVTTAFMHRFKNLHTIFGARRAKCVFFDNTIMFALSTKKNLFELSGGLFSSLTNSKRISAFYKEISAIYEIIDYFKLAEKTGL